MNKTIEYFKTLSSIPRESKNEGAVANYLVSFAKQHNLPVVKDKFNNVLIKKINKGREPVILQSHTDMVCVKEQDYNFNFATMPLKLVEEGGYLYAYKTSLGADNGIGVAMILSLLADENDYSIEALFTTDEEVTMTGAINFDYSSLISNKLISLDGFSSKQLINGCASICDSTINFNPKYEKTNEDGYTITVSGLKGGHSGADIDKNVGNAINILTEILLNLKDVELNTLKGGNQFNFIPNYATATITASNFEKTISPLIAKFKSEFSNIKIEFQETKVTKVLTKTFSYNFLNLLNSIKTGVIVKNENGGILLSQNLSCVNLEEGLIKISNRANSTKVEDEQILFLKTLAETSGFEYKIFDRQVGLTPSKNSKLTTQLCEINKQINNEELEVTTKHISVEGAIFKQMKSNLDVVIVSPDIYDVHSTKERVYLPSVNKTYNLLENFLKVQ